ncbi:hypothetical protein JCM10207_004343 [Rhodosporidiobolus poonsookiae]
MNGAAARTARAATPAATRAASTAPQPFFPVQSSPSSFLPLANSPKPPSSLWYTARPSFAATLTSLEHTLTQTRAHLFRNGLLSSIDASIQHDSPHHAVLPHPRQRRWKTTKDMATYLRNGTDLRTAQYKRLTSVLAHLEGLLPYARIADSISQDAASALETASSGVPALVVDPVSVATGKASESAAQGQSSAGLEAQLDTLLRRFQQAAAVSDTGVAVERVVGQARRLGKQDEQGRTVAVGRRKESGARVWIVPVSTAQSAGAEEAPLGRVLVNAAPVQQYFTQPTHRHALTRPLALVNALGAFNVFALVKGGGSAAQADAVAMGLARALAEWERCEVEAGRRAEGLVSWRETLKKADLIERDPRVVERKKTGRVKARKMPTWVKR